VLAAVLYGVKDLGEVPSRVGGRDFRHGHQII
jgi:hypothetical protein